MPSAMANSGAVLQEIVNDLEAVDSHEIGALALDALQQGRQRLLGPAVTEDGAEVDEDETILDQAGVEEREGLHVADGLQRRLGERAEVEALLPLPGVVEESLERQDGLSRAWSAGDDRDRPGRKTTAQDRVQRTGPRTEPLQGGRPISHAARRH